MNIVLIEPFFSGSHKQWALGYKKYSKYNIEILSPKRHILEMENAWWSFDTIQNV